ncbi:MAG: hypothetical protein IH613_15365 [Desulfuromonadales bacterium]|nr:hypothetical protein [Desulfuromonadales bacterium]
MPGIPAIWQEFLRERHNNTERENIDGFDGFQAVASIADFSKGAVAERFLSRAPSQAFRRGRFLLALNSSGNVQIIDCVNPQEPRISALLPYHQVKQMEMRGDIAFLHLGRPGVQPDTLITIDLKDPLKPRELSRFSLPEHAMSFFFLNDQLVVYTNSIGYEWEQHVHLYEFGDDFGFILLGKAKSPLLGSRFLIIGDYLLIPDLRSGLRVVDFNDPLQPVIIASVALPDQIKRLSRHGDMVFALGGKNSIYVIDLHDPVRPVLSSVVEDANYAADFMEFGHYCYYFTENGYLRVYDIPFFTVLDGDKKGSARIAGELVPMQADGGFVLLDKSQESLPRGVTNVLSLPEKTTVIDKLFWQGFLVILDDDGLVQFFQNGEEASFESRKSLQLASGQRWLTASSDRLYAGGESSISVIAKTDDDHFVLSGQIEFSGEESWDGLIVQQVLSVAAGKEGVVSFSLEHPDHPTASPGWKIPKHLESQADVRQLVSPGGDRLLAAAGPAGLFCGRIVASGQFQLDGFLDLPAPLFAMALIGDFCLVSTGAEVCVIDIKNRESLQNLGKIAFSGVEKFAVAAPDFWAGYVPGAGWSVLPAPLLVSPGETELPETTLTESLRDQYRLNLFNDHEVITVPGIVTIPFLPGSRTAGAVHGIQ